MKPLWEELGIRNWRDYKFQVGDEVMWYRNHRRHYTNTMNWRKHGEVGYIESIKRHKDGSRSIVVKFHDGVTLHTAGHQLILMTDTDSVTTIRNGIVREIHDS